MNLPNKLTVIRILLVPIIVLVYLFPISGSIVILEQNLPYYQIIVLVLFAIASFTDYLDGTIARKHNLVTTFGKFMDPIADKLLVNGLLILLATSHMIHPLLVVIMTSRDLVVDAIRLLASQNNVVLAASSLGKAKTVFQMSGIILVLLNNIPFSYFGIRVDLVMISFATIISLVSGIEYFWKNRHLVLESM